MKIKCSFCEALFNDTMEHCPNCGAANPGVVRTHSKQPLTIDELKQWYESKGLPSYDVTRFFIGENYRKPKAFGIYQDSASGNFVVYKNKADGKRAVRYEGTDEAYAVNEIFQRLKQEIIQQKKANLNKTGAGYSKSNKYSGADNLAENFTIRGLFKYIMRRRGLRILFIILIIMMVGVLSTWLTDPPKVGYYKYNNEVYYAADRVTDGPADVNFMYWFYYDTVNDEWWHLETGSDVPDVLEKDDSAKEYYIAADWSSQIGVPSCITSYAYDDVIHSYKVNIGYYDYDDTYYYHIYEDADAGWFYYDKQANDWYETEYDYVPESLLHNSESLDFYYTPDWTYETQITDFTASEIYDQYTPDSSYSSSDDWDDDDYDYDYDWGSDDSWDSGGSDWDSDW